MSRLLALSLLTLTSCLPLPQAQCAPLSTRCDDIAHVVQLCASDRSWVDVTHCDGACVILDGAPACE